MHTWARTHTTSDAETHRVHRSRSCENPPKANCQSTLYCVEEWRSVERHDHTAAEDASDWATSSVEAGRERRTSSPPPRPLAGYRESTTQIMMSNVDRTNALYYVVNVPNNLALYERCTVSLRFLIVMNLLLRWMSNHLRRLTRSSHANDYINYVHFFQLTSFFPFSWREIRILLRR